MNEVQIGNNNRMDRGHNKKQGGRRSGEIDNKIIKGILLRPRSITEADVSSEITG
jgi:hypothetical protein